MSVTGRIATSVVALAVFTFACWAALLPLREQRLVSALSQGEVDALNLPHVPFAFTPYVTAARQLLVEGPFEPQVIAEYLRRANAARPLHAPTWLDRAELALRLGHRDRALRYAETARSLWPTRPELLWRVAMFQVSAGDEDAALSQLRDYLANRPRDIDKVLSLATRLVDSRETLVNNVLPEHVVGDVDRGWLLLRLMDFARRTGDVPLAKAGWRLASVPARAQAELAVPYVELLLQRDELAAAVDAWTGFTGLPARRGQIYNGGFESGIANGGFDWRLRDVDGAKAKRDQEIAHSGCCSMRVDFDGSTDVHYHHLRQVVPVQGGERYVLTGWVRGQRITPPSGVYVEVRTVDAAQPARERSEAGRGSWDWVRFEIPIRVPDDATRVEILLRRDRTSHGKNPVRGSVWLDDVVLAAAGEGQFGGG